MRWVKVPATPPFACRRRPACNIHTDAEVVTRMSSKVFGMNIGTFGTPTVTTPATTQCTHCKDLGVTYTVTPNFLFFNGPPVSLSRTKRVYQPF